MDNKFCSPLSMEHIVFDRIEFIRHGFQQKNTEPVFKLEIKIGKDTSLERYKVTLVLRCEKRDEYDIEISLTGFFYINEDSDIKFDKNTLVQQNAVAILMPYLRSELTLITSQPELEPIVFDVINVAEMMK